MHANRPLPKRRDFIQRTAAGLSAASLGLGFHAWANEETSQRFQLSLHQYSLKKLFEAQELDLVGYPGFAKQTLGISNIEFGAEFCESLLDSPDKARAVRNASEAAEVTNRVLLCAAGNPLDAPSSDARADAVKHHVRWARVAESLGCPHIRVRVSTEGDKRQQLDHAVAGVSALCQALESSPVAVLAENIAGPSRDPNWMTSLVERVGRERLGLIADFGNFDGDIYNGMSQLLPYTKSVCTKSWEFDDAGNETKIDFQRMMRVIKQSDFRGCIAIEYLGPTPVKGIQSTATLVKRYW